MNFKQHSLFRINQVKVMVNNNNSTVEVHKN
jgi:hypothetical protein